MKGRRSFLMNGISANHRYLRSLIVGALVLVSAAPAAWAPPQGQQLEAEGCTSVIVGKLASVDGSTR
jgi:hypothetical protein